MLHCLIFLAFSHYPGRWRVKRTFDEHGETVCGGCHASGHCAFLFIICMLLFVKYLGHGQRCVCHGLWQRGMRRRRMVRVGVGGMSANEVSIEEILYERSEY